MNCDTCRYSGLCKYEDEARKFENYISDQANQYTDPQQPFSHGKPETINVIIHCTKYWSKPTTTIKKLS